MKRTPKTSRPSLTVRELDALIAWAVAKRRARGWRVEPDVWYDPSARRCCLLGAVVLERTGRLKASLFDEQAFARWIGCHPDAVEGIIEGFDGITPDPDGSGRYFQGYRLGWLWRRRLGCA